MINTTDVQVLSVWQIYILFLSSLSIKHFISYAILH